MTKRDATPRPGDEVEVTVPGVVRDDGLVIIAGRAYNLGEVIDVGGRYTVTTPVDHPSRDLPGTVRGDDARVWVKVDPRAVTGVEGVWWDVIDGEERTGDDVAYWPIIGVVPGTAAAVAVAEALRRFQRADEIGDDDD